MQKLTKAERATKRASDKAAKLAASGSPVIVDTGAIVTKPTPERFGGLSAGQIGRRNDTVNAMRYPFGTASNRDDAYTAFFAHAATVGGSRTVTLAALASLATIGPNGRGRNPFASDAIASAPVCDAGALERACKRGHIVHSHADASYTLTDDGATYGAAMLAKLAKLASPAS